MGLGYAAAAGIQGGYDALHQMIAERQKQQLLAQAEADKQQTMGLQQSEFEESKRQHLADESRLGEQSKALEALRQGQADATAAGVQEKAAKAKARQEAIAAIDADETLTPREKTLIHAQLALGGDLPGTMFQPAKDDPVTIHKAERDYDIQHPLPVRPGENTLSLTPEAQSGLADFIRGGGSMPNLGRGSTNTRIGIFNRAFGSPGGTDSGLGAGPSTDVATGAAPGPTKAAATPFDVASAQAGFKADQKSLSNLQPMADTLHGFEKAALPNLKMFLDQAGKIPDTGSPLLNTPLRMIDTRLLGNDELTAYNTARSVALREVARITNNPTLKGVLTDSARHEIENLTSPDATLKQVQHAVQILMADMQNVAGGIDSQLSEVKKRIASRGHAPAPDAPTSGNTADPLGILGPH